MTFHSTVLPRTSSSLENPVFFRHFGQIRPFPFKRSSMYKKAMADRQTDRHSNSIGPLLLGWGLKTNMRKD